MNDGKFYLVDLFVIGIIVFNGIEGVYRKVVVL